jgi:hypothetical protein
MPRPATVTMRFALVRRAYDPTTDGALPGSAQYASACFDECIDLSASSVTDGGLASRWPSARRSASNASEMSGCEAS